MRLKVLALALVAVCATAAGAGAAPAMALAAAPLPVPARFVGMMADGPLFGGYPGVDLAHELDLMVATGVETLRVDFSWADAQPYADWGSVPPGDLGQFPIKDAVNNIPTTFAASDEIVTLAAQRGLTILPVVIYTPPWAAASHPSGSFALPQNDADYARYLKALVKRYGPGGTFWRAHPTVPADPIHMWQIWNEPSLKLYWPTQPFIPTYLQLLKAAHGAIKSVDRHAKVVLAGMPNYVWQDLADIYKVAGARRLFDVVAAHPYTSQPAGVIEILKMVRDVMNRAGDRRKPIIATEVSWPSSLGQSFQYFGFETTASGQASKLRALLPMLAADRTALGLQSFYYYTWMGLQYKGAPSFQFAGLLRYYNGKIVRKPAFPVFRRGVLKMEACKVKAPVAPTCLKPG